METWLQIDDPTRIVLAQFLIASPYKKKSTDGIVRQHVCQKRNMSDAYTKVLLRNLTARS